MVEQTVSIQKMLTVVAWTGAVLLMLSAVLVGAFAERWWIAVLLAETACVVSAVAATLTVRCFLSKLAALVRVTAAESREPARIHTLRH